MISSFTMHILQSSAKVAKIIIIITLLALYTKTFQNVATLYAIIGSYYSNNK